MQVDDSLTHKTVMQKEHISIANCCGADVDGFADTTFIRTRKHNCCDAGFTLLLRTILSPISCFPFLFFSILSGFTNFLPYFWPHVTWSSCRLNFCQYPTRPQISFGKLFFQLCESSPRVWQMLARIDIPVVVNSFFLHDVQIRANRFCYVPVLQGNRECFFLKHIELNSGFIAITIDEVTLNRPEVGTGFSVIGWFCRLRLPAHLEVLYWNLRLLQDNAAFSRS